MLPLIPKNIWKWIEENRQDFEPPVGNKVIWKDSQFVAMVIRGPNRRRDFHVDPSDEIFYMLKGDMVLEYMENGKRKEQIIREGDLMLVPGNVPHSPHRPADSWGLVIEITRKPSEHESMQWYCEKCDHLLHEVTMHVANIETELKQQIQKFDSSLELRTCRKCGHVQPDKAAIISTPPV